MIIAPACLYSLSCAQGYLCSSILIICWLIDLLPLHPIHLIDEQFLKAITDRQTEKVLRKKVIIDYLLGFWSARPWTLLHSSKVKDKLMAFFITDCFSQHNIMNHLYSPHTLELIFGMCKVLNLSDCYVNIKPLTTSLWKFNLKHFSQLCFWKTFLSWGNDVSSSI